MAPDKFIDLELLGPVLDIDGTAQLGQGRSVGISYAPQVGGIYLGVPAELPKVAVENRRVQPCRQADRQFRVNPFVLPMEDVDMILEANHRCGDIFRTIGARNYPACLFLGTETLYEYISARWKKQLFRTGCPYNRIGLTRPLVRPSYTPTAKVMRVDKWDRVGLGPGTQVFCCPKVDHAPS